MYLKENPDMVDIINLAVYGWIDFNRRYSQRRLDERLSYV
jgi:hypothetical protein